MARNTERPNGKSWKKSWAGNPPKEIVEKAQVQSKESKRAKQRASDAAPSLK